MTDLSETIAAKSEQLTADDLLGGPITIRITHVAGSESAEQPIAISFEGDGGKPYMPCKSMRRVLVQVWGKDGHAYPGRSLTLYRDPTVAFGGLVVGGIRISHASHLDQKTTMALTASKAKKKPFTVLPLQVEGGSDKATTVARQLVDRIAAAADSHALGLILGDETTVKQRAWLADKRPELAVQVDDALAAALARLEPPDAPAAPTGGPDATEAVAGE